MFVFLPSFIPLSGISDPPLLLLLLVLEVPPPLTLLNDSCSHNLPTEPPQQRLLGLVVVHHDLHVVGRFEEEHVGVTERGIDERRMMGRLGRG